MICCQRDGYLQMLLIQARAARIAGNLCFWFAHVFDRVANNFERARRDAILLRHPFLKTEIRL